MQLSQSTFLVDQHFSQLSLATNCHLSLQSDNSILSTLEELKNIFRHDVQALQYEKSPRDTIDMFQRNDWKIMEHRLSPLNLFPTFHASTSFLNWFLFFPTNNVLFFCILSLMPMFCLYLQRVWNYCMVSIPLFTLPSYVSHFLQEDGHKQRVLHCLGPRWAFFIFYFS